jgi:uncharacterized membrane protein
MPRIQNISRYLLIVLNGLLFALPMFVLLIWAFIDSPSIQLLVKEGVLLKAAYTPEGTVNLSNVHWIPLSQTIGMTSYAIGLLPLFLSLFTLKALFRSYQAGEIFTARNAHRYRYLGWLFFLDALVAKPLSGMLLVLAVTLSNPPGHRFISVSFGLPNVEAIFCGILVIVISWVMIEASKLQEEQALTV